MPVAIAIGVAAGVAGGFVAGSIAIGVAIGMAAFSMAYAMSIKPVVPQVSQQELKQTLRSSRPPKAVAFGEFYVSGALIFAEEQPNDHQNDDGTYSEWLYMALGICDHPISYVQKVVLNENPSNQFGSNVKIAVKNNPTTADQTLLRGAPSWKSDMIGRGTTWISIALLYHKDLFSNGIPTIRLHGLGHNGLYDPRTKRTGYSNNAAIIIYNFFHVYRSIPKERLIVSGFGSFIDAANLCDEIVTNPDKSTSKRYTINGVFRKDEKPSEVLASLLASCGATLVRVAGKIGILPAAWYGLPTFTISESDIVGTVSIQPESTYGESYNTIKGTFVDPNQNFSEVEFPTVIDEPQKLRDGMEISTDLKLKFVTDVYQAQRLASIQLKRALAGGIVDLTMNLRGLHCVTGRVVRLDIPTMGLSGEFRVLKMSAHVTEGVNLTLAQDEAEIYDDAVGKPYDPPPLTELPSNGELSPPSTAQFLVEQVGEIVQGYLSWRINDYRSVKTQIVIKNSDGSVVLTGESMSTTFKINGLVAGAYLAELRSVDKLGRVSPLLGLNFSISKPPNLTRVRVNASNWSINLIPEITGGIPSGVLFEFWYLADNQSFLTGRPSYTNADKHRSSLVFTGSSFSHSGLIPDRFQHYWVRAVSSYGSSDFLYVKTGTTRVQDLVTTVVERLESIEIRSSNYVAGKSGYKLFAPNPNNPSEDGKAEFNDIVARGHIEGKSGTFSGELKAASGTFSGTVQAAQVIGVKQLVAYGSSDVGLGHTDRRWNVDTGYVAPVWGDNKTTYIVECNVSGRIETANTSAALWGASAIDTFVLTRWSGQATIFTTLHFKAFNANAYTDTKVNWKLYKMY